MATDEMGRILLLLEEGKINADEAERLLRAVETTSNESKTKSAASADFTADPLSYDPFKDLSAVLRGIGVKVFGQVRRQRRAAWRHSGHFGHDSARADRARTMSVLERVWWVAYTQGLLARTELTRDLRLCEDLGLDECDLEVLEDLVDVEFNIELPVDASSAWKTAGDVVASIEKAIANEPEAAEPEAESGSDGADGGDGGSEAPVGVVVPEDPPAPRKGKSAAAAPTA